MTASSTESLLSITLQAAVPLWQLRLKERTWDQITSRLEYIVGMIANHGDNILFRGAKKGDTAAAFNALAEGIAILSFCPGGVKVFGGHWEAKHPALGYIRSAALIQRMKDFLERKRKGEI